MRPAAVLEGELLILRDARCVLVVRVEDVVQLIKRDRWAWTRALRLGKAYRRGEAAERRGSPYSCPPERRTSDNSRVQVVSAAEDAGEPLTRYQETMNESCAPAAAATPSVVAGVVRRLRESAAPLVEQVEVHGSLAWPFSRFVQRSPGGAARLRGDR